MTVYPNCKVNLGLRIVGKRADGYHNLETIFYPVYGLHDVLTIEISEDVTFSQSGICVDCAAEDNLILKCYRKMAAKYPKIRPVRIHLEKNIPFGAGLGGGSSDAAFTATALNEMFELNLTKEQLADEVRSLGADCPFFIYNTPCYATGIGDILTPISLDLSTMDCVLIKPDVNISTREAYANLGSFDAPRSPLVNDFEASVFPSHPILGKIKQHLQEAGAVYTQMSGSGSTILGLFEHDTESGSHVRSRLLDKDLSLMVIFDDTLRKA